MINAMTNILVTTSQSCIGFVGVGARKFYYAKMAHV